MLFLLLQVALRTFCTMCSMEEIAKFIKGISALVSTLSQDDRDDVRNENCLHSREIQDGQKYHQRQPAL